MRRIPVLIAILLLAGTAQAAESEYYIGPRAGADVFGAPSTQAAKVAHLDRLTAVRIDKKLHTWWHIITIHQTPVVRGWVAAGVVRQRYQPSTASRKRSSFFSGFASLFGYGNDSSTETTAVLGVRGFEEEKGATAAAGGRNATAAVQWMETLHVSPQEEDAFIREGDLNP